MTNKAVYMRLIWRTHRSFAIFSMVFITLLQFLILFLITTFNVPAIIQMLLDQFPENLKVYFSNNFFNTLTLDGAAAFGLNHPLVLTLLSIVAISVPVAHIPGEIETGTLELVLAHPFRRKALLSSLWSSGCLILLFIIIAALIGSTTAAAIYHHVDNLLLINLLKIGVNLWLLFVLVMSYTLLFAAYKPTGRRASNIASVLTLVFYFLFFLSQLWEDIKFTAHYNIFNYYEPQKLMFGNGNFYLDCTVLTGLIILCYLVSRRLFIRRDIP
jgi:ABC-type transport system involved in multi-copper enzyme maturation permease subunit